VILRFLLFVETAIRKISCGSNEQAMQAEKGSDDPGRLDRIHAPSAVWLSLLPLWSDVEGLPQTPRSSEVEWSMLREVQGNQESRLTDDLISTLPEEVLEKLTEISRLLRKLDINLGAVFIFQGKPENTEMAILVNPGLKADQIFEMILQGCQKRLAAKKQ
jgi:hypothetical protein